MLTPTIRLDTSNLSRAVALLDKYSKNTPAESLNKTAAFVVNRAKNNTPVTDQGRIDTELQVTTTPQLVLKGPRKGLPLKSGKKHYHVVEGGLATKIILARMWPASRYNRLTDRKNLINRASFSPGEGTAAFWEKVDETAQRMAAKRHSGTGFFKISWNALLLLLAQAVPRNYRGAVLTWAGAGRQPPPEMGNLKPALPGYQSNCTVQNRLGFDDAHPTAADIQNAAAHRILEPVLQNAINAEFSSKMAELARRELGTRRAQLLTYGVVLKN